MASIERNNIKLIITDPNQTQLLVKEADQFGRALKEAGLTTSQIRALFGEVRQIQAMWETDDVHQRQKARRRLILLKPKMAYRVEKEKRNGVAVKELVDVLDPALDDVMKATEEKHLNENFTRFVEFFEAILAYHKAAGGR